MYRLVIDGADVASLIEESCNNEMCNYVHYSNSLTASSSVAVDIIGCVTERISPANITARENIVCNRYLFTHVQSVCSCKRLRRKVEKNVECKHSIGMRFF